MMAALFQHLPSPLGMICILTGLWVWLWDARKSYLAGNFLDARVSRICGIVYLSFGVTLWVTRRLLS